MLACCFAVSASMSQATYGQSVAMPADGDDHLRQLAEASLRVLVDWWGPLPFETVTIDVVDGLSPRGGEQPGVVTVRSRWLTFRSDPEPAWQVTRSLVRQYFRHHDADLRGPFAAALLWYATDRVTDIVLEGSAADTYYAPRFFGGFVPVPSRSVLLGGRRRLGTWRVESSGEGPDVERAVRAFETIERFAGWPALSQAIATLRVSNDGLTPAGLGTALSAALGTDLGSLVEECFDEDAVFDYRISEARSAPADGGSYETTLVVQRGGSGVFDLGDGEDREPGMPVLLRFAGGAELRDWFDGAAASTTLVYQAPAPLVHASIDPDGMLRLDVDRSNNTFIAQPSIRPAGVGLALHWMTWLQQTLITYSGLV